MTGGSVDDDAADDDRAAADAHEDDAYDVDGGERVWMDGRAVRRLTRQAMRSHGGGKLSELVGEVYTVVFSVLVAVAVVLGVVETLNASLRDTGAASQALHPSWLALVAGIAVIGATTGLASRLGPLGVGGGQASWWLPLPAERRGLLRPRMRVVVALALAVGALTGLLVGVLAGGGEAALEGLLAGTAVALAAAGLVVAVQVRGFRGRLHPAVRVGEALVLASPALALAVVLSGPAPLRLPELAGVGNLIVVAGLLVVGAVLLVVADRRLDHVSGIDLRARGAVTQYAAGAATSLDTRELGRALSVVAQPDARRRSSRLAWVRGPVSAIVTGDALVMLRSWRHVLQVLVTALVPVAVALTGWSAWTVAPAVLLAGYVGALATAEGARRAEMAPVLDRAFPVEASQVRRLRLLWPLAVMVVWTAAVLGIWSGVTGLGVLPWLPLAVVAAPAFAAGVVRGAYRKPTDWSKPLVSNPFGPPIPPGLFGTVSRGPDVMVVGLIPLILGLVAVASPLDLLPWQLLTSAIACAIAVHVPSKDGIFAQARGAQEAQARSRDRGTGS